MWQALLQRVLQHSAEALKHTAQAGGWRSYHAGSSGGDSADDRVSSHDTASTSSSGTAPLHASGRQPRRTQQLLPVRKWVMLLQGLLAVRPHSASSHASVSGHTKVQSATQVALPAGEPSTVSIDNGALPQMDSATWVTAVDAVIAAMQTDTPARRLRAAELDVLVQLLAAAGELLHHRSEQRRQGGSQAARSAAGAHAQKQESGLAGLILPESWAALQNFLQGQWREQAKAQERWLQVVLSALRPQLPQLSSKQVLCVLRALGRGTGRTDNQPFKPHPQWVQALFQAMQAPPSPSDQALPAGARKQTAAATATATSPTGGSAVAGLQAAGSSMEAMDGPQLAAVCKALSSLVRASDVPPEWLQVSCSMHPALWQTSCHQLCYSFPSLDASALQAKAAVADVATLLPRPDWRQALTCHALATCALRSLGLGGKGACVDGVSWRCGERRNYASLGLRHFRGDCPDGPNARSGIQGLHPAPAEFQQLHRQQRR